MIVRQVAVRHLESETKFDAIYKHAHKTFRDVRLPSDVGMAPLTDVLASELHGGRGVSIGKITYS